LNLFLKNFFKKIIVGLWRFAQYFKICKSS